MSIPVTPAPDPESKEPALKVGTIVAVVGAVLSLLVSFGFTLTPEQTTAILAVTTIAAPLVSAWFTRSRVFSPAKVAELLRKEVTRR